MAITIIQERKKQRYLILALALVMFAILAVVWLGFLRGEEQVLLPSVPTLIYAIPKVDIDWQMLGDLRALTPQPFEEIGVFEGKFGRGNPFVPY